MYQERFYREFHQNKNMLKIQVTVEETDVMIIVDPIDTIEELQHLIKIKIREIRNRLKEYIRFNPEFLSSLKPISYIDDGHEDQLLSEFNMGVDLNETSLPTTSIIRHMIKTSSIADVGPMATVAGVTSEIIGRFIMSIYGDLNILVENGGDIFLNSDSDRKIAVYTGDLGLENLLTIRITSEMTPLGICTSSGTLGHSFSYGNADALVVLAKDTALADGFATALANKIKSSQDIHTIIEFAKTKKQIIGLLVVVDHQIGAFGEIEFI